MAGVSSETASGKVAFDGVEIAHEDFDGGYSVCFESHSADQDLASLFRGLPDDQCPFVRLGYVVSGKTTFRFDGREETYEAGEAYCVPPGHTPVHHAGAEIVEFSPTAELGTTVAVVMQNLAADGRSPRMETVG